MRIILKLLDRGLKGTIVLENGLLKIEFLGIILTEKLPASITAIYKINEFNADYGCIAVATNIGEEYIDLEYLFQLNRLKYINYLKAELIKLNTVSILKIEDSGLFGSIKLENGLLIIDFLGVILKEKAPAKLTTLVRINEFNIDTGQVLIDGNIEDEFIDLESLFKEKGLNYKDILKIEMSKLETRRILKLEELGSILLEDGLLKINLLGHSFIEKAPKLMKEIIKVNSFDVLKGTVIIEDNNGRNYMDLQFLFEEQGLNYDEILKVELDKINKKGGTIP